MHDKSDPLQTILSGTPQEAERIDRVANEQLLKDRKLTLILDLDQTLIHATVDPTVEEWRKDPTNPNHEAAMVGCQRDVSAPFWTKLMGKYFRQFIHFNWTTLALHTTSN